MNAKLLLRLLLCFCRLYSGHVTDRSRVSRGPLRATTAEMFKLEEIDEPQKGCVRNRQTDESLPQGHMRSFKCITCGTVDCTCELSPFDVKTGLLRGQIVSPSETLETGAVLVIQRGYRKFKNTASPEGKISGGRFGYAKDGSHKDSTLSSPGELNLLNDAPIDPKVKVTYKLVVVTPDLHVHILRQQ